MALSETDFEAKILGIVTRGIDDALRLQDEEKKHAATPPANVGDRHHGASSSGAPVGDAGAERQAELRGYDLALAHSLQAAEHLLQEVAKQRDISVADVFDQVGEGLAENRKRLGVQAGVVSDGNG